MLCRGATKFEDGSNPFVGRYQDLIVVVDNNGLQAWLEDEEGCPIGKPIHLFLPVSLKEVALAAGNKLLAVASEMTESQLQKSFENFSKIL